VTFGVVDFCLFLKYGCDYNFALAGCRHHLISYVLCPCCYWWIYLQLLTAISTIDDLNYPEKTDTYYIVNVPYIFSACWKVCLHSALSFLPGGSTLGDQLAKIRSVGRL